VTEIADQTSLSDIRIGHELGAGGQAAVFECSIDSVADRSLLFKHYHKAVRPELSAITALVAWPDSLSSPDAELLDRSCSWPLSTVIDDSGTIVGVIMRQAPPQFYIRAHGAVAADQDGRLRELQYLILGERSRKLGLELPPPDRTLQILEHLSEVLDLFERHEIVHGDISMRNILWSASPRSECFVLDCDSAALRSRDTGFPVVTTPGWTDPRLISDEIAHPDVDSDRFALAAGVYRAYFQRPGSDLESIDFEELPETPPSSEEVRTLFSYAFTSRTGRPNAQQWAQALQRLRTGDFSGRPPKFARGAGQKEPGTNGAKSVKPLQTPPAQPAAISGVPSGPQGVPTPGTPAQTTTTPPKPGKSRAALVAVLAAAVLGVAGAATQFGSSSEGNTATEPIAVSSSNVATARPDPTPTAAPAAAPTITPAKPTPSPQPSATPSAVGTPTSAPAQPTTSPLVSGKLNVRAAPSTGAEVVTAAEPGDEIRLVGDPTERSGRYWQEIEMADSTPGWVAANLLGNVPGCSHVAASPIASNIAVRTSGSFDATTVSTVPNGTSVTPVEKQGDWVRVSSPGAGWIFSPYVEFTCAGVAETYAQQRAGTFNGEGVNLRNEPSLDGVAVHKVEGQRGDALTVLAGPTGSGWSLIQMRTPSGTKTAWVFAAFVLPSADGWTVVQSRSGAGTSLPLYSEAGRSLGVANMTAGVALVTDNSGSLWETQQPDGTIAYLDPDDVVVLG